MACGRACGRTCAKTYTSEQHQPKSARQRVKASASRLTCRHVPRTQLYEPSCGGHSKNSLVTFVKSTRVVSEGGCRVCQFRMGLSRPSCFACGTSVCLFVSFLLRCVASILESWKRSAFWALRLRGGSHCRRPNLGNDKTFVSSLSSPTGDSPGLNTPEK